MNDEVERALVRVRRGTSPHKLESQTLDFKTQAASLRDTLGILADASVCFANSVGGAVVVGVADRAAGPEAFVGTDLDVHAVRAGVFERTRPNLEVFVEELTYQERRLLIITVSEGLQVYGTSDGRHLRRRRDTCPPMSADDVVRLREERASEDWSARSARRGGSDAADTSAIARARALLGAVPDSGAADLASREVGDLLDGLGLLKRGALTNAGWLMFGQRDGSAAPSIIYQHRPSPGGEPDRIDRFTEPLVVAVERLLDVVEARLKYTPVNLPGGQQIAVADFPPGAVREALLNAIVHGDHRTGQPIQIEHSPEELSIVSPGPLVAGVTPENILRHPHRARFASLFHGFRFLGLVEQVGLGVDRMFREMLRFGRRPPEISEADFEVKVRFTADQPNVRIARFVNDLPRGERDDLDVLLVLGLLRDRRSVRAADVADVIQRTSDDAQRLLRRLAAEDLALVEPTPGTLGRRFPNYRLRGPVLARLGPAVAYHRAPTSERDRKIVEHVQEYGAVNNRTVQNLFDVDVYRASAILRELVQRGVLVRTSEQTRGNLVRYGQGPDFPEQPRRR